MTKAERQAAFHNALDNGKYFEYWCIVEGVKYVRNTRAGYCKLLTADECKSELKNNECFIPCFSSKKENPSKQFNYYFDYETDTYYAVKL